MTRASTTTRKQRLAPTTPAKSTRALASRGRLTLRNRTRITARVFDEFANLIAATGVPVQGVLSRTPSGPLVVRPARRAVAEEPTPLLTWFELPLHDNEGHLFGPELLAWVLFVLWQIDLGFSVHDKLGSWAERWGAPTYIDASFAVEIVTRRPEALRRILERVTLLLRQEAIALRTMRGVTFELIRAPALSGARKGA